MQLVSKLHDVVESIDFTAIDIGLKVAAKRLQNALERSGPLKLCSFRQRIPDLRYLVNDFPPGAPPPQNAVISPVLNKQYHRGQRRLGQVWVEGLLILVCVRRSCRWYTKKSKSGRPVTMQRYPSLTIACKSPFIVCHDLHNGH